MLETLSEAPDEARRSFQATPHMTLHEAAKAYGIMNELPLKLRKTHVDVRAHLKRHRLGRGLMLGHRTAQIASLEELLGADSDFPQLALLVADDPGASSNAADTAEAVERASAAVLGPRRSCLGYADLAALEGALEPFGYISRADQQLAVAGGRRWGMGLCVVVNLEHRRG